MLNQTHGAIKIFAGNASVKLAEQICQQLDLQLGKIEVGKFSDGETSVNIKETVRGCDVFVVQSTCSPVNDNLMELLVIIDALKRASAGRITAVIPYFGYARQDRKARARDPISAKLVADILQTAGANRVLTMDLHSSQLQGFFNVPVDNLMGMPLLAKYFKKQGLDKNDDFIVVSPDVGSVARSRAMASKFNAPLAIIDKRRPKANVMEVMNIIGDVKGKTCLMFDDMIDTAGTITQGAQALADRQSNVCRTARLAKLWCWIQSFCLKARNWTKSKWCRLTLCLRKQSSVCTPTCPCPSCTNNCINCFEPVNNFNRLVL